MGTADGERWDIAIIGGGVMGCAIALALASAPGRRRVVVLERSVPGAEASSAAAGILGAQMEAHGTGPFLRLSVASRERFPALAAELRDATGIDVEWRPSGSLKVAFTGAEEATLLEEAAAHRKAGLSAMVLGKRDVTARESAIGSSVRAGLFFEQDARVDPPLYLRALRIAAERKGAHFASGRAVKHVAKSIDGAVRGVALEDGSVLEATNVVVAAGSWSSLVGGVEAVAPAIRPARGQIVELRVPVPLTTAVISGPRGYLSPRDDGRILVGSTLEFVGFEKLVTAGAVRDLLGAAIEMVPALAHAELCRTWSNFRPHTSDELPLIGKTRVPGLFLATGHYRNGILLSAITAEIVRSLVAGEPPPIDVTAFSPER